MINFKEWLSGSEGGMAEVAEWINQLKSLVTASVRHSEGFISVSISSLVSRMGSGASIRPAGAVSGVSRASEPVMALAASVEHPGAIVLEVTEKGWKGKAAADAVGDMGLSWPQKDVTAFSKAMSGGKRSIPQLVGKEMGLLFEVEVFIFLVQTFKLKVVGSKDLAWAVSEQARLGGVISGKIGVNLGRLVVEFVKQHAIGGKGMAHLLYSKAMALVRECLVDSIEFMGGEGAAYSTHLKSDTADLRIGCSSYLTGQRGDVGFSLKAVTETQVQVRSFSGGKALQILGAGSREIRKVRATYTNPLFEDSEKREAVLDAMGTAAEANYRNKPKKFTALLELLVTGGADTIPAYRSLLKTDSEPGWSGAIGKDFVTGEGPGRKLGARLGGSPVIDVKSNPTYVQLTYMVGGGNHYGTAVKFEPSGDGSTVSVTVSNLLSKGGRGY